MLRAQTLSLRTRDYVESARIIGERGWRIISHEILPNLVPVVASSFLFTVLYGVGTYTAIAFLGLVNPEHWSWGAMLFDAQNSDAEVSGYWWWYIPPGLPSPCWAPRWPCSTSASTSSSTRGCGPPGLTRRQAKKTKGSGLPKRFELGLTPVVRPTAGRPRQAPAMAEQSQEAGI